MRKIKEILFNCLSLIKSSFYLFYWIVINCIKSDLVNHLKKDRQGKTIDIIVNGPSFAKKTDYVKNDGFDKCMVNFAANTQLFWELKPAYYCVSDPRFFGKVLRNGEFEKFFNNIRQVDWDMIFFVTYSDYIHNIKNCNLLDIPHIRFVPFHSTPFPFSFSFKKIAFWLFRTGQAMPIPMSVSVPVIMNAINSGYSFINLYGYDQDWLHNVVVDDNNQVCLYDTHFYNVEGKLRPWKKNDIETFRMYELLKTQTELFESYWFIKEYADFLGNVKITNMSPVSLIDAFDRK